MTTGGFDPNQNPQGQPPGSYPPPGGQYPPPQGGSYPPPPQGSYPPPQQGNYPPPQQGSYPPPQQSGSQYGQPGAYQNNPGGYPQNTGGGYPPQGYGAAPSATQLAQSAFTFAWERFKNNAGVWIGFFVLIGVVEVILFFVLAFTIVGAAASESALLLSLGVGFMVFVLLAVGLIGNAALVQGALVEVQGRTAQFGDFTKIPNLTQAVLTSLLVAVATGIGFVIFYIPGIIIGFLTHFAIQFAVDRGTGAVGSIKGSYEVVVKNFVPVLLLLIAIGVLNFIGSIPFGLGLLVTAPMSVLALTFAYRQLAGAPTAI